MLSGSLNVGLVTGPGSDILVVDIDGPEGAVNAKPLNLPPTYTVRTGSGGTHLYYRTSLDLPGGTHKLARRIDVRCHGGMVVAPPSVSGHGPYEAVDDRELADVPAWIIDRLTKPHVVPAPLLAQKQSASIGRRVTAYLAKCPPAISGSGGHDALFSAACKVGPGFGLSPDEAYNVLAVEYNPRCEPPWSERELRHKIDDAYKVTDGKGAWLRDQQRPQRQQRQQPMPDEDAPPAEDEIDEIHQRREIDGVVPASLESIQILIDDHLGLVLGDNRPLRMNQLTGEIEQSTQGDKNPRIWDLDDLVTAIRLGVEKRVEYETAKLDENGYPVKQKLRLAHPDVKSIALKAAREAKFSPVREYMESLPSAEPGAIALACSEALGLTDALSHILWRKWLIGGVARVMKPGCQLDTVLVLVAPGGEGKSSAFRAIGGPWFSDTHLDMTFKRENSYMQLHRCHIYEIPELEGVHTEKERSRQKSFISSRSDDFRAPYDAVALGASTNSRGFMASDDPAFNRRLWPLEITGSIDVDMLAKLRDQIWSEALAAYRAGEPWHLDDSHQQQLDELRGRHETLVERDAREPTVARYLADPQRATKAILLSDVMRVCLHLQPAQMAELRVQGGVGAMMRALGWEPWYRRWTEDRSKSTRWVKGPIRGRGRIGALPALPLLDPPDCRDEP
jgi:predicted P-loop ATPase